MGSSKFLVWGSYPLARGLLSRAWVDCTEARIIPARAGFTCMTMLGIMNVKDHPRSRGVYVFFRQRSI